METFRLLLFLAIIIHITLAFHEPDDECTITPKTNASDPGFRLPKSVTPLEMDITLKPNMVDFTFDGETKILLDKLSAGQGIKDIYLHAKGLEFSEITITPQLNPPILIEREDIPQYDFLLLKLSRNLTENVEHTLIFKYNATMGKDMKGFYRSWYKENGVKKWLATTQFQPGHARKAFPCFDEPGYKSIYKISIECPVNYTCISNMKVMNDSTSLVRFHPTPKMSSYLVAFIVSQFRPANEVNTPNQFRVWARPEAGQMGKYAFDIGQSLVESMDNLIGIKYYDMDTNMKMDQAAIPDFSAGAMENWGLLTYREAHLMYDNIETSIKYKQQILTTLAHEISHMWFGDYVTCNWWSETWLNEGFASYWQYFLADRIEPDYALEDQFIIAQLQTAFRCDTSVSSSPLTNSEVNSPEEVSGHFGTITYNKGASVIRMIEHWIGNNDFILGLNRYLRNYAYGNVVPENLFGYLQNNTNISEYDATIDQVMGSFTRQNGYPIVHVSLDHITGLVNLEQKRFTNIDDNSNNLYSIPITYTNKNMSDFENTKPAFIMSGKTHSFPLEDHNNWLILNLKQTGFYRVSYDDHLLDMLLDVLNSDERTDIHRYNRAQIVDDAMNMAREGHISYSKMFKIIDFLDNEVDYAPWSAAFAGYSYLRLKFLTHQNIKGEFDKHILSEMDNLIKHIGFESNGNYLERIFRSNILKWACDLGHTECIAESIKLFQGLIGNNTSVDPDLRDHVYCNGLRYGNDRDYDFLWNKYLTDNVVNERIVILSALGCTKNQEKILQFLQKTLEVESDIKDQDRMSAFNSALGGNLENAETTCKFIMNNIAKVKEVYTTNLSGMFSSVANRLNPALLETFEKFITSSTDLTEDDKTAGKKSIKRARKSMDWVKNNSHDILDWLHSKYNSAGCVFASFPMLILPLATLFLNI